MATLTYLTGAAAVAGAATTPALSGLVNGGTLIVTVEATADFGSTLGNPKNVKLRFDATYMQLAADGKL